MKKFLSSLICLLFIFYTSLPAYALNDESELFKIRKNKNHLHSRLSKRYTGYVYELKNISSSPIKIENIVITDNISGKSAYLSVKRTAIGAAVSTLSVGTALALPTLSLSIFLSIIAVPFVVVGNCIGNTGAKQESKRYNYELNIDELAPNESVSFTTLSAHRETPDIDVIYINPQSKLIETFCYNK